MKQKISKLAIFSILSFTMLFVSCKKDEESDLVSTSNIKSMDELVVDPNFSYKTSTNVSFNLKAEDNQGKPLTGVRIDVFTDYKDNGGSLITSGVVNSNGIWQFSRTLPSYLKEVVIATKFVGLPSELKVNVENGAVNCTLGGKVNLTKAVVTQITPQATLSKVKFLCNYYDNNGVPNNIMGYDAIDNLMLHDLNATLPESQPVPDFHPSYIQNTPTDTRLIELCDVYVTFVSEGAGYKNVLGFYTYNLNNPPTSASQIDSIKVIFPNASLPGSGGNLQSGAKVYIGRYPANTGIGWVCISNGWSGTQVTGGYGTPNGIKYSNPSFNPEVNASKRRHNVLLYDQGRQLYILGFEDMNREGGADDDFNDLLYYVKANPVTAIDNTNVPTTVNTLPDTDGDGISDIYDDYPSDPTKAFNTYFPSKNVTGTLAFEDLWPTKGDYDINDVVVDYNFNQIQNAQNKVVEIRGKLIVRATGAGYHNGFGFQLPVLPSAVTNVTGIQLTDNYINVGANGLEQNQSKAVIIAFDNAYKHFTNITGVNPSGYAGINTSVNGRTGISDTINIVISLSQPLEAATLGNPPYNPFIISDKRRGYEIHLPDMIPTDLVNAALFGTGDDNSNPSIGRYYKTKKHHPWGLDFATRFEYPVERVSIIEAYSKFAEWAQSNGNEYRDWYSNPLYRDNSKIYK